MNESNTRTLVVPAVLTGTLLVAIEFFLGTWYGPTFQVSFLLVGTSLLTACAGVGLLLAVHAVERRFLAHPWSPMLLLAAIGGLHLLWILGPNHVETYLYLLIPVAIELILLLRRRGPSHREFHWLLVLASGLAGTGLWKSLHVLTYSPSGLSWEALPVMLLVWGILHYGHYPYEWIRRRIQHRPATALVVVGLLLMGSFTYWFLHRGTSRFNPYFDGRLADLNEVPERELERPNIIFISLDTLRWDRVPGAGNSDLTTPHLKSLKNDSLEFTQAISTSSWTLPAHASLFSALPNEAHGAVVETNSRIYSHVPLYTQYLRQLGYATGGFTDGVLVRRELGFSRGFDRYWENPIPYQDYLPGVVEISHTLFPALSPDFHSHRAVRSVGARADLNPPRYFRTNVEKAKSWMDGRQDPFFLFLHTYQIHDWSRYYPESIRRLRQERPREARALLRSRGRLDAESSQARVRQVWARLYDYGVEQTDRAIGDLISFLRSRNLYRDSLIVLLSDHGEGFRLNTDAMFHGAGQLDDILIRVPLWVKLPNHRFHGQAYPGMISLTDVFPLIVETLGVEPPITPQNYPAGLLSAPDTASSPGRTITTGSIKTRRNEDLHPRFFVRSRQHKYTRNLGKKTAQYYRVQDNRAREISLPSTAIPSSERERLQSEMERLIQHYRENPDPYERRNQEIAEQTRRELQGMGYLD